MVYSGPNRPVAPIDDPYRMFDKLWGGTRHRESMRSVLDELNEDLAEAVAWAHDLGHTPFGHAGEEALERDAHPLDLGEVIAEHLHADGGAHPGGEHVDARLDRHR